MTEKQPYQYGQYNDDGSLLREAKECILTRRAVTPTNSVRSRVRGTPYFYRVLSSQYHRVTDEDRARWQTEAKRGANVQTAKGKASDGE